MEISLESSEMILEEKPFIVSMLEDKAIDPLHCTPDAEHENPQSFPICYDNPSMLLLPNQENEDMEEENTEEDSSPMQTCTVVERPLLFFKAHGMTGKKGRKTVDKHFRSKGVQVNFLPEKLAAPSTSRVQVSATPTVASKSVRNPEPNVPELIDCDLEDSDQKFKRSCLENTRILNSKDSMHFLGVINDFKFLIPFLENRIKLFLGDHLSKNDVITLILRKIRLNHSFLSLSYEYGIYEFTAKTLFRNHINSISKALSQLIQWFSPETIVANLPLIFWARYMDTYVILHCFEIQIQDVKDHVNICSDQKQGSKLKYLIGISPDGTIMYVSKGFLGRYSDVDVAIKSGFLNYVANKTVMVHVGFKNLEIHLAKVNANLVRGHPIDEGELVNLNNGTKNSPVEGCINRLRRFAFLVSPHATDNGLQNSCDGAIRIACALVNTHSPLVKTLKFS